MDSWWSFDEVRVPIGEQNLKVIFKKLRVTSLSELSWRISYDEDNPKVLIRNHEENLIMMTPFRVEVWSKQPQKVKHYD